MVFSNQIGVFKLKGYMYICIYKWGQGVYIYIYICKINIRKHTQKQMLWTDASTSVARVTLRKRPCHDWQWEQLRKYHHILSSYHHIIIQVSYKTTLCKTFCTGVDPTQNVVEIPLKIIIAFFRKFIVLSWFDYHCFSFPKI